MDSRRRLGQHFLKNKAKIKEIIDSLKIEGKETIIETGSGHGELTKELSARVQNLLEVRIIAIEKDKKLAEILRNKIETDRNLVEIVAGDALEILPQLISQFPNFPISKYKIIGNIPYYLTGRLLRIFGELEPKPKLIVLTIQKEVAERLTAKPPRMNLLAASVQFWAKPEIIDYIPKRDFSPPPKVDSAIIKLVTRKWQLVNRNDPNYQLQITNYYKIIKILFKQPRKTIWNNLKGLKINDAALKSFLKEIGVNPKDRPQNLGIEEIKKLSGVII